MIGGTIVQVIPRSDETQMVEVLDTLHLDRCWRTIPASSDVRVGDRLWWQSFKGFHSRQGCFADRMIGRCKPATYSTANAPTSGDEKGGAENED